MTQTPLNEMGLLELRDLRRKYLGMIDALETKKKSTVISDPDASRREWAESIYAADRIEREEISPLRQRVHEVDQQILKLVDELPSELPHIWHAIYMYKCGAYNQTEVLSPIWATSKDVVKTTHQILKSSNLKTEEE
jgi:hypothetical protein